MTRIQIILAISAFAFIITVIQLIRNEQIDLKYSLLWLFAGLCMMLLAINPVILSFFSRLFEIFEPTNLLFLVGNIFLIAIVFSLTVALSRSSNRIRNLTQELALLKTEVEKINEFFHK